jgi:GNAT superfamily N-acetyltransferase
MPVTLFCESHRERVLAIRDATFASMNLGHFVWQPCQQIESLDQPCFKYVFEDGAVKGYGAAYQLDDTHFRLNLIVDPHHLRKGIGTQLLNRIEQDVIRDKGTYLQARVFEHMPASRSFASASGFTQIHIMRGMTLHAADFCFDKWKDLGQQLSQRFVVTTLKKELESGADAVEKLARLYSSAREGWPSPDPTWRLDSTPESFRAPFTKIEDPEHFSILKDRDEYIGFTSARNLGTGTAVHPNYRNMRIATYLKAFDIDRCIKDGEERFESSTANPAMQRVNEKLGYRFNGLAEIRFVKELS